MKMILPEKDNLPLYPLIAYVAEQATRMGVPVYLVGGYVRDVLLGKISFDLDFVTEGDAHYLARQFDHLGHVHLDRFGTAHWTLSTDFLYELNLYEAVRGTLTVDFATARTEHYLHAAALPTIDSVTASLYQDLQRRDFTINALALRLSDLALIEAPNGLDDLHSGQVRVLHERSFRDDPTRLFRAARYATRFNFQIDSHTETLIPANLQYLDHLSGERIAEEFRRIFDEDDPFLALNMLQEWGVLHQVDPTLRIEEETRAQFQRLKAAGYTEEVTYWCILLYPSIAERIIKKLELSRLHIDSILKTQKMDRVIRELPSASKPSTIVQAIETLENRERVNRMVCEATWAIHPSEVLLEYRNHWRNVCPTLTGEDLKAMGLRPGPLFGTILDRLRAALLDGEIHTVEEERALIQRWINEG